MKNVRVMMLGSVVLCLALRAHGVNLPMALRQPDGTLSDKRSIVSLTIKKELIYATKDKFTLVLSINSEKDLIQKVQVGKTSFAFSSALKCCKAEIPYEQTSELLTALEKSGQVFSLKETLKAHADDTLFACKEFKVQTGQGKKKQVEVWLDKTICFVLDKPHLEQLIAALKRM